MKSKLKSILIYFSMMAFSLSLAGCIPLGLIVGAGATAGSVALETRSLDDSINDRAIQLKINKKLADSGFEIFKAVTIDVVEGRVLLTGIVNNQDERVNILKYSWENDGVEDVINEIKIASAIDIIDISRDIWIKTKIVTAITFDKHIFATNYEISVVNGYVYLFGISKNNAEVARVIAHVRDVESVRKVISHMVNINDKLRLERLARIKREKNNVDG